MSCFAVHFPSVATYTPDRLPANIDCFDDCLKHNTTYIARTMKSHGLGRVFTASININFLLFVFLSLSSSFTQPQSSFPLQLSSFPRSKNNLSAHPHHRTYSMNPFRPVYHFGVGVGCMPRAEFWFGLLVLILFIIVVNDFVDLVCELFKFY